MKRAFFVVLCFLVFAGCRKGPVAKEPTMTSGRSALLVTESHEQLLRLESEEFRRQYPEAELTVAGVSTREAIVDLLNDSVRTICVDRPFNDEEQSVVRKAGMNIVENKIAEDALAVIVHQKNPLRSISFGSLKKLLDGSAENWNKIPESRWSGPVTLVLTGRNSGAFELLQKKFFDLSKEILPTVVTRTQREAVEMVAREPGAISFVSLAALASPPSDVRVLAVEATVVQTEEKFVKPSQWNIYHSLYPFHYSLYLYNNETKAGVGAGFSTFAMTVAGQKIIQNAGLVPASIPTRIIQLSAEQ